MRKISQFVLKLFGWKTSTTVELPAKSVICVAPHTSNYDFFLGKLYYMSEGRQAAFMMKKSWFVFPFKIILDAMGGIPVDRSQKSSVTQQVVDLFNKNDKFQIAITPEGTRKKAKKWKMGFYQIAIKANVPISLAYIDYQKKEIGISKIVYPTGDEKADLKEIYDFYRDKHARYPEQFHIPEI